MCISVSDINILSPSCKSPLESASHSVATERAVSSHDLTSSIVKYRYLFVSRLKYQQSAGRRLDSTVSIPLSHGLNAVFVVINVAPPLFTQLDVEDAPWSHCLRLENRNEALTRLPDGAPAVLFRFPALQSLQQ